MLFVKTISVVERIHNMLLFSGATGRGCLIHKLYHP
jgi:hypothetical protein